MASSPVRPKKLTGCSRVTATTYRAKMQAKTSQDGERRKDSLHIPRFERALRMPLRGMPGGHASENGNLRKSAVALRGHRPAPVNKRIHITRRFFTESIRRKRFSPLLGQIACSWAEMFESLSNLSF